MRVAFLASEVAPYSKTGGLGDVAGALPPALARLGVEVVTLTPLHRQVPRTGLAPQRPFEVEGHLVTPWRSGALVFLDIPEFFDRPTLYGDGVDEHRRYAVFQLAALEWMALTGWKPDIIHCNDWQTGLVPALVNGPLAPDPIVGKVPTVFTIHNLGYQGRFSDNLVDHLGLAGFPHMLGGSAEGGFLSFMETALLHADLITTVSPTYAREIQTPEGGAGLDHILVARSERVLGILNGIDTDTWDPTRDRFLPYRYSARSLWRKEWVKRELMAEVSLPYRQQVPVVGVVTRLAWQKGIEIMRGPLLHFLDTWDMRFVLLGNGESRYEEFFRWLATEYPTQVAFHLGYSEQLSHRIEAGSDIFLMPSLYEPCGLNQMYSLAYGTAPVVRRTGGLSDTVEPIDDDTGTGFVFDHYTEDGLGWALGQALQLHTDRKRWQAMQRRQMRVDNSWERRAGEYLAAYRSLTG
jgi:starch synthase